MVLTRRITMTGPAWPKGLTTGARAAFTRTLILRKDNSMVGRIEGTPGNHLFRGLLDLMLTNARAVLPTPDQPPAATKAPAE